MNERAPNPQINIARIPVGAGAAGAIFTVGSLAIFVFGIPLLQYLLPAALIFGCAIALVLHWMPHPATGASWILSAPKK